MTQQEPVIDTSIPHEARMYDYWLGGKDNYAADRALGDAIAAQIPTISFMAKANRAFLGRSVRFLVKECGIRQFLDIGTGIPTAPNVHQVAQEIAPECRVVYVDNDPIVLAHARALMQGTPEGATAYIPADLRDTQSIIEDPVVGEMLDLTQPVGLMLVAMLMYFEQEQARGIVTTLMDALPVGSYVTITHPGSDFNPEAMAGVTAVAEQAGMTILPRDRAQVTALFDGLEPVEPGIVPVLGWRPDVAEQDATSLHPDQPSAPDPSSAYYWSGVARKV